MKTKLIALALAAGVVAGTAGIASTASAAPATAVTPAVSVHVDLGGLVGFHFGGRHHGYRHRRFCRRMFVLGFRYGNPRARYLWRRHCRRYYYSASRCRAPARHRRLENGGRSDPAAVSVVIAPASRYRW